MTQPPHILIVGGGIGGLCAAVALRRAGFADVAVFEQAPAFREVGFGLTLWPNAVKALDRLGLGGAVRALRPTPITRGTLRRADGRVLIDIPAEAYERAFGAPNVLVHRADLLAVLSSALPPGTVRHGRRCEGFVEDDAGVAARFADAPEERGELLVGADGIHSVTRRQLFGDGDGTDPLRYAGYTAWRGVCRFPHDHPRLITGETWGRGRRFGVVPIRRDEVYWFAAADAPEGGTDAPAGSKAKLLSLFAGWHEPVEALVRATDEDVIERRDLYDREPRSRWSSHAGRVTLLGDAAHPTTPNLGQGACQSIEDAVVLADCMKRSPGDPRRALNDYESARAPHTARVVRTSRSVGRVAQWSHPLACAVRDRLMSHVSVARQLKSLAWVVGHEV